MAKKVRAIIRVQGDGGRATAAAPVGPALGQHGINILEFLKACQRDGLVRIERDRRGGLRVFQGTAFGRPSEPRVEAAPERQVVEPGNQAEEVVESVEATTMEEAEVEPDVVEVQPKEIVDTTAEVLGRATGKRRSRSAAGTKTAAPRKRRTRQSQVTSR